MAADKRRLTPGAALLHIVATSCLILAAQSVARSPQLSDLSPRFRRQPKDGRPCRPSNNYEANNDCDENSFCWVPPPFVRTDIEGTCRQKSRLGELCYQNKGDPIYQPCVYPLTCTDNIELDGGPGMCKDRESVGNVGQICPETRAEKEDFFFCNEGLICWENYTCQPWREVGETCRVANRGFDCSAAGDRLECEKKEGTVGKDLYMKGLGICSRMGGGGPQSDSGRNAMSEMDFNGGSTDGTPTPTLSFQVPSEAPNNEGYDEGYNEGYGGYEGGYDNEADAGYENEGDAGYKDDDSPLSPSL